MTSLLLLLSCTGDPETDDSGPAPEPEFQFSFAIFADPHITANVERQERLAGAVQWVNENAAAEQIELVWVVGDIGWGEGLPIARALLDELDVTYLPVLGDNEIHFGDEAAFDVIFDSHYGLLENTLDGWQRGTIEVYNPVYEQTSWLQNFSFEHRGLRWLGLDWNSRSESNLYSEFAELNDFEGGTLPFFTDQLGGLEAGPDEDVLLFSHHPMHIGAFDLVQMEALASVTGPIDGRVAGAYAGHVHLDATVEVEEGGYTAFVTDAIWDDKNTVRLVEVWSDGTTHTYVQRLEVVPW
jgi:hypothetical protein